MITVNDEVWQWVMLGLDALALYGFRHLYHKKVASAEEIEALKCHEVTEKLKEVLEKQKDSTLPYACIEGVVVPIAESLQSQFNPAEKGVIHYIKFVEHKSKRSSGFWNDIRNVIKEITRMCGFIIVENEAVLNQTKSPVFVEVEEPLSADYLMESLTPTFDKYTPNTDSVLTRGIDRIFGEVSKGYQETEKMLLTGTKILGIGQLVLSGGNIMLEAPSGSNRHFILSTLSKKQIVSNMKTDARLYKLFMWLSGLFGSVLLALLLRKTIRRLVESYKISRMYRQIQQQRELRQRDANSAGAGGPQGDDSSNCIICLDRAREVVLLECGHICLCLDCARSLPHPQKCPVCRASITRYVPVFTS